MRICFSHNISLTKEGIELSIELQKDIVRCGYSLIAKKTISSSGQFRFCIWRTPGSYTRFFHPLALTKLALFLIDAYEVGPMLILMHTFFVDPFLSIINCKPSKLTMLHHSVNWSPTTRGEKLNGCVRHPRSHLSWLC